jgi:glutamine synthetase
VLQSAVEAFETIIEPKNMALFARQGVFSESECRSRHDIMLENYVKVVSIEAATMLEMAKKQIYTACVQYVGRVADSYNSLSAAGVQNASIKSDLRILSGLLTDISEATAALEHKSRQACGLAGSLAQARAMRDEVLPAMRALRRSCDAIETLVDDDCWPMPTYTDLLHRVKF